MEPLCLNTTVFLSRTCVTEKSLTCSLWWLTCLKWTLCSVSMLFGLYTIPSRILSCEDLASPKVVWLRFGSSVFSHAACILIALWKKKMFCDRSRFYPVDKENLGHSMKVFQRPFIQGWKADLARCLKGKARHATNYFVFYLNRTNTAWDWMSLSLFWSSFSS